MKKAVRAAAHLLLMVAVGVLAGCHAIEPAAFTSVSKIRLETAHGRHVVADGKQQDWSLRQSEGSAADPCQWFTQYDLGQDSRGNHSIALQTCYGRFVTAPLRGTSRLDRQAWQESALGDCGQFTREPQSDGRFAIKTCGGKYLTAGDAGPGWEPPLQWAVIVENPGVEAWEKFKIEPQP
jgi:hypothetical protein